jgi:DNA-binding IclR family transcriptional regulator
MVTDVRSGETLLVRMLGNSPKLRILDFFLDNPTLDFCKEEVVKELGMSKLTLYKYFGDLEELGAVKVSRKFGKAKLYRINLENPLVRMLAQKEIELSAGIAKRQELVRPARPVIAAR